jgi:hypothetical protein
MMNSTNVITKNYIKTNWINLIKLFIDKIIILYIII